MKYIEEKKDVEKRKLSSYVDYEISCVKKEVVEARIKYIISIIGDIEVDEDTFKLFISEFQTFGGKYSVRTEKDTFKGMYSIMKRFPFLSKSAISELWGMYIKDLFEVYSLEDFLDKYFELYGKSDETFMSYLDSVSTLAEDFQKQFIEESKRVEELEDYSDQFKSHIAYSIKYKHKKYDDIIKCIPEASLLKKDEEHLLDLSRRTRIFMGCGEPVSYKLVDYMVDGEIDQVSEDLKYYYYDKSEDATFTKSDFLQSVKKRKEKVYRM